MAFTPAHIIAVVPIAYAWPRPIPVSALVIGSMVPDWPLYIPLSPAYSLTHSVAGVFTACLPLGFLVYLLFQFVFKRPLYELLPQQFRERLKSLLELPSLTQLKTVAGVAGALVLGAMTHVVWDAFTHGDRWGVEFVPALNHTAVTLGGDDVQVHEVLQLGTTFVGVLLLLLVLLQWVRTNDPQLIEKSVLSSWLRNCLLVLLILLPISSGILSAIDKELIPSSYSEIKYLVYVALGQAGYVFAVLIGCYGLLYYPVALATRD